MAFFNEIGAGRYNRLLQKIFNIKGGPPSRSLASDVIPIIPFFSGAENRYLESWDRFAGLSFQAAGGAGTFSQFQLRNPVGSNTIAVVERIVIWEGQNDQPFYNVSAATADLATPANNAPFDTRGRTAATCLFSRGTPVSQPTGITMWQGAILANTSIEGIIADIHEFPILPGSALKIGCNAANLPINATVWWRERALEDSEIK